MRYLFLKYAIAFALVVISGTMLLDVSQRVQSAEREVRRVDRAIERERDNIRALEAEWAYLNDPARLEEITASGLGLSMQSSADIISNTDVLNDAEAKQDSPVFMAPVQGKIQNITYSPDNNGGAQ
ncbi:MAG: cell division protein FtsL [Alphaproteobacteria bacterium]